jgi:SAM-dependent methyltransferase
MSNEYTFYKEYPKTCEPTDFWGQVRRTHNGKPVGEEQISLIVNAMVNAMELTPTDQILDLCCGNGALSDRWMQQCKGGVGVDFSEVLIDVAQKHFMRAGVEHVLSPAEAFAESCDSPERFTVGVCYGSWQFLPGDSPARVLTAIRQRFPNIRRLVLGNVPDRETANGFFALRGLQVENLDDPGSAIGVWWSQRQLRDLAEPRGWSVEFRRMDPSFYAAPFRFDAVLRPRDESQR